MMRGHALQHEGGDEMKYDVAARDGARRGGARRMAMARAAAKH